jgi:hypothetical protein
MIKKPITGDKPRAEGQGMRALGMRDEKNADSS